MSIQLEVLADEVFDAAAAQARLGSQSTRHPFGEIIRNRDYPDLFFLNGIAGLVAPSWSIDHVDRVVAELLSGLPQVRIDSRDPATIASLRQLTDAGYRLEVRVAMVHVFEDALPSATNREGSGRGFSISEVDGGVLWAEFEESLRSEARDHGWTQAMTGQYLKLCRWRAEQTAHRYYLLYESDRRLSHVGLFQNGRTVYLHGLYTRPDARRAGAGGALARAMVGETRRLGGDRLVLQCTDDGYLPAFYARLGYRPVGQQHIWTKTR